MRNHATDRDAPKLIEPPTGPLEIYSYDPKSGRALLVEACGEDIARAEKVLRRLDGPACRARGGVVIGVRYGTAPSQIGPMKAAVMVAHVAAKTASPRKSEPAKARVAVERTEIEVVEDEPSTMPTNTDVEPSAPSTTTDHDEDTVTAKTANNCTRCSKYPIAGITATTRPDETTWCAHCRRTSSMRLAGTTSAHKPKGAEVAAPKAVTSKTTRTAARAVKPARATRPTVPDQAPVVLRLAAVPTNTAVLDRVSRALVVVEQLGGIERAEAIAAAHALPVGP